MRSEAELKALLKDLAANEYAPPEGVDLQELAFEMSEHLGSTDAELRDELIYTTFIKWVMRQKRFDGGGLRKILNQISDDEHMFHKIGEANTDSVFRRSFSVLLWPPILIRDREEPFLSSAEVTDLKAKMIRFLTEEQDHRGFVAGKGWAHAAAHGADALDDLVQCPQLQAADLGELLEAVSAAIAFAAMPHLYEEDERMVTAVLATLRRGLLSNDQIQVWLGGLATKAKEPAAACFSFVHFNVKAFLRSLYFRASNSEDTAHVAALAKTALGEIDHFRD
jgi:hypothetical protein